MESIISTLKDAVLSSIISTLKDAAKDEFCLVWGFKDELKSLEERIKLVAAFLSDAESKSSSHAAVELWLNNLRVQVYDAVAVLDELRYEQLRREIEVEGRCWNEVTDFFSPSNHLICRLMLAHRIKKINSTLDNINKRASELGLQASRTNATNHSETIGSAYSRVWVGDLQNVVGRKNEVSTIVRKLVSSNHEEERLPVISIVGMAGCGKTTLAHLVCQDESVMRNFDKSIMWVSVSDNFEVRRILSDMLEVLTKENRGLSSEPALVGRLSEVLKDKKYLLILDDIWSHDPKEWERLKNALLASCTTAGSKVIVTTRSMRVASSMQSCFHLNLKRLSHDESWTLFRQKAFAKDGAKKSPELLNIGEEIVSRCGGVPLVVSVLGSLLYSKKSVVEWVSIRDHEMWGSIVDIGDRVNDILKLSFDHLSPSPLKHCFSYSSIFPKDSIIEKKRIVQMWMALELLPSPQDGNLELEDVGNDYFHQLLGNSLLQEPNVNKWGDVESCKMHDLLHDLAQGTSKGYCLVLKGSQKPRFVPDTLAHLSLFSPTREMLDQSHGCFRRLQTLFLEGPLMADMFDKLTLLRVLVLVDRGTTELPKSVEKLKHLRYLDVSRTGVKKLYGSITRLYNLQTLRIGTMTHVPERLGNLVSLRHFYGRGILVGVGKLTELQTLQVFKVSREQGCLIGELGGLNKLKGNLMIEGLEEVENLEEAKSAKLSEKSNIKTLKFHWVLGTGDEEPSRGDEDVLEGLRPHSNLRSLEIEEFKGLKLASWMMSESVSALSNLANIKLWNCERCEQVPTLGHLPNLKKVFILGLKNVRRIGAEFYGNGELGGGVSVFFPVLTELALLTMSKLEEWVDVKDEFPFLFTKKQLFPNLQKFETCYCHKLIALPISIFEDCRDIREISIDGCRNIKAIPDIRGGLQTLTSLSLTHCGKWITELPRGIETLTSLNTLNIIGFPGVVSVADLGGLTRLEKLEIGGFSKELDEFPLTYDYSSSSSSSSVATSSTSSVRSLRLYGWEKLQHLPQQLEHLSASLTQLSLWSFAGLESLPEWLGNLSSLQSLGIYDCRNLKSMPSEEAMHRLTKLQQLGISLCPVLKERCVKGSGTEWHKIQHIPYIIIDHISIQDNRV